MFEVRMFYDFCFNISVVIWITINLIKNNHSKKKKKEKNRFIIINKTLFRNQDKIPHSSQELIVHTKFRTSDPQWRIPKFQDLMCISIFRPPKSKQSGFPINISTNYIYFFPLTLSFLQYNGSKLFNQSQFNWLEHMHFIQRLGI